MGNLQRSFSPPSFSTSTSSSSSSSSLGPHPLQIDSELWLMVEKRTQEILYTIQPAFVSEQKRKEVIDYVRSLIKGYFAVEVFPFGSVPLKTYLPDGDIDLMILSHQSMEEDLARDVFTLLQCEEQDPGFQVNDVQYIQAQVNFFQLQSFFKSDDFVLESNIKVVCGPINLSFSTLFKLSFSVSLTIVYNNELDDVLAS